MGTSNILGFEQENGIYKGEAVVIKKKLFHKTHDMKRLKFNLQGKTLIVMARQGYITTNDSYFVGFSAAKWNSHKTEKKKKGYLNKNEKID